VSDAMGVCKPRPSACDLIISPVCGCDGRNYTSACEAATKGVTVKRSGICF